MTNRQIWVIAGSVLVLGGTVGISKFLSTLKEEPEKKTIPDIKRAVKVDTVFYNDITTSVSGTGRVSSQQQVDLISEVQGKLLPGEVNLKKGERFRKGDLIARIYDQDASYTLQSRKSMFLTSLANLLPDLKIDYPKSYEKWDEFFQSININEDLPDLPDISEKKEKIFLSAKGVLAEYYGIKSDEVRLNKYRIYAPFSGSFTNVMLEVGSVANPGSRIGSIIKTSDLEIEVPLETRDAMWVNVGDKAIISDENSSLHTTGYIARKSEFVDPATQSFNVFVRLNQKAGFPVFNGQYLHVEFPDKVIKNSMEIDRGAVFNSDNVFAVDSGFLKIYPINIRKVNEKSIIFDGLKENTLIVAEPLANANENTEVQIHN